MPQAGLRISIAVPPWTGKTRAGVTIDSSPKTVSTRPENDGAASIRNLIPEV